MFNKNKEITFIIISIHKKKKKTNQMDVYTVCFFNTQHQSSDSHGGMKRALAQCNKLNLMPHFLYSHLVFNDKLTSVQDTEILII